MATGMMAVIVLSAVALPGLRWGAVDPHRIAAPGPQTTTPVDESPTDPAIVDPSPTSPLTGQSDLASSSTTLSTSTTTEPAPPTTTTTPPPGPGGEDRSCEEAAAAVSMLLAAVGVDVPRAALEAACVVPDDESPLPDLGPP